MWCGNVGPWYPVGDRSDNLRMDLRTVDVERSEMLEAQLLSGRGVAGRDSS